MKRTKCLGCQKGYVGINSKTNPYASKGYSKKCYEEKLGKPQPKEKEEQTSRCPHCNNIFVLHCKRIKFCSRNCQKDFNANINTSKAGSSSA